MGQGIGGVTIPWFPRWAACCFGDALGLVMEWPSDSRSCTPFWWSCRRHDGALISLRSRLPISSAAPASYFEWRLLGILLGYCGSSPGDDSDFLLLCSVTMCVDRQRISSHIQSLHTKDRWSNKLCGGHGDVVLWFSTTFVSLVFLSECFVHIESECTSNPNPFCSIGMLYANPIQVMTCGAELIDMSKVSIPKFWQRFVVLLISAAFRKLVVSAGSLGCCRG